MDYNKNKIIDSNGNLPLQCKAYIQYILQSYLITAYGKKFDNTYDMPDKAYK